MESGENQDISFLPPSTTLNGYKKERIQKERKNNDEKKINLLKLTDT